MRKTIFIIAAVAAMACACNKSETVKIETPNQISFAQVNQNFVKSNELTGKTFRTDWVMKAYATRRNNIGEVVNGNYFKAAEFTATDASSESAQFYCASPKYWPVGTDVLDFIVYAGPKDSIENATIGVPVPSAAANVAEMLTFGSFESYKRQIDLVYAVANKQTRTNTETAATLNSPLKLTFKHAQALLEFQAKTSVDGTKDSVYIDSIFVKDLIVKGDFVIDNTKIKDTAYWKGTSKEANYDTIPGFKDSVAVPTTMAQVGKTLLIPEQDRKEITIKYHVVKNAKTGSSDPKIVAEDLIYTFTGAKGAWSMGKKYTYKLTIDPSEINFKEEVTEFVNTDINVPEPTETAEP